MDFFEIKVKYQRNAGEEVAQLVKESYVIEAVNLTDAESRLMEEIAPFVSGECEIPSCNQLKVYDIVKDESGDMWFKGKAEFIVVDDNGREKRSKRTILVQASSIDKALKNLKFHLENLDCEIVGINKTPIVEVYRAV